MRANTQRTTRGHETRGARVGRTKQWGTETLGDLWKGEGWGWGTRGTQDGHYRDFQEGKQGISGTWVRLSRKPPIIEDRVLWGQRMASQLSWWHAHLALGAAPWIFFPCGISNP